MGRRKKYYYLAIAFGLGVLCSFVLSIRSVLVIAMLLFIVAFFADTH